MKGQITACGFVTHLKLFDVIIGSCHDVKGQITACGFVTFANVINDSVFITLSERPDYRLRFCYCYQIQYVRGFVNKVKGQITACGFVTIYKIDTWYIYLIVKGQITACGFVTPL